MLHQPAEQFRSVAEPSSKHWADRHYEPMEAVFMARQYLHLDPDFFIRQFAHAGCEPVTCGSVINFYPHPVHEYTDERMKFLDRLLRISGVGKALRTSLRRRGMMFDPPEKNTVLAAAGN